MAGMRAWAGASAVSICRFVHRITDEVKMGARNIVSRWHRAIQAPGTSPTSIVLSRRVDDAMDLWNTDLGVLIGLRYGFADAGERE